MISLNWIMTSKSFMILDNKVFGTRPEAIDFETKVCVTERCLIKY